MSTRLFRDAIQDVSNIKSRIRQAKQFKKFWVIAARLSVLAHPEGIFIMEDVRVWAVANGLPELEDSRAWGAITRALKADGYIVETGDTRRVTYVNRNSQLVKEWKRI